MSLPRLPKPPSARELRTTENRLVRVLRAGLANENIQTRFSRELAIVVELDRPIEVWISAYADDLRWWRITWPAPLPATNPPNFRLNELTLHHDECDEEAGRNLGRLLRDPDYHWPLFSEWQAYPHYAWSKLAYETYREFCLLRDAWARPRHEGRFVPRRSNQP